MLTGFATSWNNVPQPVRDFIESLVSAGIVGVGVALVGLNLSDPTLSAKVVIALIAKAFIDSVIAAARHGLAKPAP